MRLFNFAPKQERNILLGQFEDLFRLWDNIVVVVTVSYSQRCGSRRFSTKCPVEVGSFESTITTTGESSLEKEQKAAYREMRQLGERLQGIENAISSFKEGN